MTRLDRTGDSGRREDEHELFFLLSGFGGRGGVRSAKRVREGKWKNDFAGSPKIGSLFILCGFVNFELIGWMIG